MVPVIAVVGKSGSGKTTLLTRLIPELKRRGFRVGAIKHSHHPFELDRRGKDSWRLFQAGAEGVAFTSSSQVAVVREVKAELTLDELIVLYFGDVDLVLVEGYKEAPLPKIEVIRSGEALFSPKGQLLAIVGEGGTPGLDVPRFSPEDVESLADLIVQRFFQQTPPRNQEKTVTLLVNGQFVPLAGFVQEVFRAVVLSVIGTLKRSEIPQRIQILIEEDKGSSPADG